MKKASFFLTFLTAILLFSCGSDSDSSGDDMDTPTPLTSLTSSKTTLPLGDTEVNTTSQMSVTIENKGNQDIATVSLSNEKSEFVISPKSFALDAGATKTITVDFTPTEAKDYTDKITAKSGSETLLEISLTGKGILNTPDPVTSLAGSKTTLAFSDTEIDKTSQLSVTIENNGNQDIATVSLSNEKSEFVISPKSFALDAGASKTITVDFTPTKAIDYSDKITAKSGSETLLEISLTGKGTTTAGPPPVLPAKTTFTKDIKPIIESKCTPCHTPNGNNRDYTSFSNSSSRISNIINRINRAATGDSQLMPRQGPKLPQDQLDLFQKWLDDGKLE